MQYIELRDRLRDFLVFSVSDIRKIDSDFHLQRLSEWQDKGYIKKIINEYYIFSDTRVDENFLFLIANTIYQPSYVSSEMALSYYGLIPESVYSVTSVSSRTTRTVSSEIATFSYRKMKPELLFGYALVSFSGHSFKIAEVEKAIADFLYFHRDISSKEAVDGLRINRDILLERVDVEKFRNYIAQFHNKALQKRADIFCKTLSIC